MKCRSFFKQTRERKCVLVWTMDPVPDLVGPAPNVISWTTYHGVDHLNGRLRPPYTDNRNLMPPLQIWDLLMYMFETAQHRDENLNIKYTLRMGFGASGANRYNLSMRGRLDQDLDPDAFLGRIEWMLDSNDTLDIRDIRLLIVFVQSPPAMSLPHCPQDRVPCTFLFRWYMRSPLEFSSWFPQSKHRNS
ncbi:hypothetical protein EDD86DRAFT_5685 [Gorgonomyces haynaldii]|nr:hypothetical protein EDD86DRAFT_5685 [Gorgonomyces haynaldii]